MRHPESDFYLCPCITGILHSKIMIPPSFFTPGNVSYNYMETFIESPGRCAKKLFIFINQLFLFL